jgi:pimeloyl-ACP methyl ester carboxylesterase
LARKERPLLRPEEEHVLGRLERDGVALFYEVAAAQGEPPILLVHGWCCDHTYFSAQFEHFAKRGHRVVAVELR